MIISVHQPQYIPWLGYFEKIARSDAFVFLDNVQYKEREFQNRNKIRTSAGWMWLTVPVVSAGRGRQRFRDVRIDNSFSWRNDHWKSVKVCYATAPHFRIHEPFFAQLYGREWDFLWELNVHIITYLLKAFEIQARVYFESDIGTGCTKTDRIIELCRTLGADAYLSGSGGREYLEEDAFERAGISLEYQDIVHPAYRQQFISAQAPFMPRMSAVDMLFNEGGKPFNTNMLQSCYNAAVPVCEGEGVE